MTNLVKYEEAVRNLAAKRENFDFPNADALHATIVTSAILDISQEVRFFVKNLDGVIADNKLFSEDKPRFIKSLQCFLDEGKCIKIVVQEGQEDIASKKSQFYTYLKNLSDIKDSTKSVEVKLATDAFKSGQRSGFKLDPPTMDFFYMVGDNSAYRINFNRDKNKAFCNFNHIELASKLVANFDKHYPSCPNFQFQ